MRSCVVLAALLRKPLRSWPWIGSHRSHFAKRSARRCLRRCAYRVDRRMTVCTLRPWAGGRGMGAAIRAAGMRTALERLIGRSRPKSASISRRRGRPKGPKPAVRMPDCAARPLRHPVQDERRVGLANAAGGASVTKSAAAVAAHPGAAAYVQYRTERVFPWR